MSKKRETRKPWAVFSIMLSLMLMLGLASSSALKPQAAGSVSPSDADKETTTEAPTTEDVTTEENAVVTEVIVEGKVNASFPAQSNLKSAVFTEEELALAAELGVEPEVWLGVVEMDMTEFPEELALIKKVAGDKKVGVLLDLALGKLIGEELNFAEVLNAPILITFDVPADMRQDGRKFTVIRLHDGVAVELEDLDSNPNTITISTDRFSFYALAYEDVAPKAADSPKTGDNAPIAMAMILLCASGMLVVGLKKREMK